MSNFSTDLGWVLIMRKTNFLQSDLFRRGIDCKVGLYSDYIAHYFQNQYLWISDKHQENLI